MVFIVKLIMVRKKEQLVSEDCGRPWPLEWEGPADSQNPWEGWSEAEVFREQLRILSQLFTVPR